MEADVRLLPVLPDLLIDLAELVSSPEQIVTALQAVGVEPESLVLDLGCGKGAVAVAPAQRLALRVEGIDDYVARQERETERLGTDVICALWVLRRVQ